MKHGSLLSDWVTTSHPQIDGEVFIPRNFMVIYMLGGLEHTFFYFFPYLGNDHPN